ncbi:HAD hydrolase-like protein [Balneolaceae bacterium YR4-1]|uniref:phosphoglycolate phosphatase n=1 Tax=Halalkalibaculum roseum TaxID=2709311 RepID=A0A6M1SYE9_9BACT|nr:HAD hydrolase-like protein [Halalkalibaculum roseum]NGP78110.1 HAD hydrolase-like protein [Halalkalibaculum roseum]
MKPILLFDIDGTLLSVERNFMHSLISEILDSLSLDSSVLADTAFAGRTDQAIFRSLLGNQQQNDYLYRELKTRYLAGMHQELKPAHVSVYEHTDTCLSFFRERNHHMGLLTGNFKEIAAHKLSMAGYNNYFTFGAYGCDHADRNLLGSAASKNYRQLHEREAEPEEFIIVGDTPLDIECARHFGCRCVVVTTGHFSREELAAHDPDLILDSLEKPEDWFSELVG